MSSAAPEKNGKILAKENAIFTTNLPTRLGRNPKGSIV